MTVVIDEGQHLIGGILVGETVAGVGVGVALLAEVMIFLSNLNRE